MKRIYLLITFIFTSIQVFAQSFPITPRLFTATPIHTGKMSFVAHSDTVYFAHQYLADHSLFMFSPKKHVITTANSGIVSTAINVMHAHNGQIYFGTDKGLSVRKGNKWTSFTTANSNLPSDEIQAVAANNKVIAVTTPEGLSYKPTGSSTWVNLSHTKMGTRNSWQTVYPDQLLIKDSMIYFSAYLARPFVSINWVTGKYFVPTIAGSPVVDLVTHNNRPYAFTRERFFRAIGDTSLKDTIGNEIWIESGDLNMEAFTDKYGQLWQVKPHRGQITFSTFNADRMIVGNYSIPVSTGLHKKTLLAYDPVTDSIFSFNDNLAFSLDDARNPKTDYRPDRANLDINRVSAPIHNNGILFKDFEYFDDKLEIPKGSERSPVFSSGMWIGGLDDDDNIHLAAMTYRQSGDDFWPAPLNPNTGEYNPKDTSRFDRVWKVNKSDVQHHVNVYSQNLSVKEGQTTEAIWSWPGNRTVGSSDSLAPFVDRNGNGIYEPGLGDYPDFPGDQCVYWVMNDKARPHGESGAIPLGVEVHGMAYAYACEDLNSTDPKGGINYTTFYRYKIINQSDSDYHDTRIGMHIDADLGNYSDDYVGSHITQNMGYCYNGDDIDEEPWGYDSFPPMISSVILNAPVYEHDKIDGDGDGVIDEDDEKRLMGKFMYYDNDFTNFGNPNQPIHYYNYLNGLWKNGDCLTRDYANGRTGSSCTSYLFPGTSDPTWNTNWTETTAGNTPADRRFLISTYPFELKSKQSVDFEFALVFSRDEGVSNDKQLSKNLLYVKAIKDWYYHGGAPSCFKAVSTGKLIERKHAKIYPVPSSTDITIETLSLIKSVRLTDVNGKTVGTILPDQQTNKLNVSLTGLSTGVYFVQTSTDTGMLVNRIVRL